ncbi:sensor histidine kinase [Chondrinema litorale]|uniref:sensor histidine kinase n=1 Tax=Chondrinema litorale TaxID=2994555 RepID=UPI002543E4AA|nr:ATP-binding protein [Chondrinema litorale]UZR97735.1 ATP-binding protein [Chondrinema litorale]
MEQLVKELLQYSRIGETRDLTLIDCSKLVSEVILDLNAQIIKANAQITVGHLPEIEGYETEIRQLFQNLLSNAIKFRKQDINPEIEITYNNANNEHTFSIKDNGIGIDFKFFENIFVIFKRLHVREKYEGTGIGLAHCKKIVELHGGKIWVESNLDKGSNFLFTL